MPASTGPWCENVCENLLGSYLAYAPTVNLQYQGLGRYLAYFLKAAANRSDVRFVVACPSWAKEDLLKLCELEGVDSATFDIMSLPEKPVLLRIYQGYLQRKRLSPSRLTPLAAWGNAVLSKCIQHRLLIERQLATSRNVAGLLPWAIYGASLGVLNCRRSYSPWPSYRAASRVFPALMGHFAGIPRAWHGISPDFEGRRRNRPRTTRS